MSCVAPLKPMIPMSVMAITKKFGKPSEDATVPKGDTRQKLRCYHSKLLCAEEFKERTPQRFERVG